MEIKEFWVVTYPTPLSTVGDICFKTDAKGLALQFRGGLDPDKIVTLYTEEKEATMTASTLILHGKQKRKISDGSRGACLGFSDPPPK